MLATAVPGAAQQVSVFTPQGLGSCGEVVAAFRSSDRNQIKGIADFNSVVAWVWGYISAYNIYHDPEQQLNVPDGQTIELALTEYCRRCPTHMLSDATRDLVRQLKEGQQKPQG
jgi:hypothetical protein